MSRQKKFKNIHWDKRRKFLKELEEYKLSKQAINVIDITTNNNVLVNIFNTLLRYERKDYHLFTTYTYLIKLYLTEILISVKEISNYQEIEKEIEDSLTKQLKTNSAIDLTSINLEKEYIKNYSFNKEEIVTYLSYDAYYQKIAKTFSKPFDNEKEYYVFAYLLAMYINLDLLFNKTSVPENYHFFTLKLRIQQDMVNQLTLIIPHNYNEIIMVLNKWLAKYEKRFNNRIYRKLEG